MSRSEVSLNSPPVLPAPTQVPTEPAPAPATQGTGAVDTASGQQCLDCTGINIVRVNLTGVGDTYLDEDFAERIQVFIDTAAANGVTLHFNSAYRTPEYQQGLRNDPTAITPASNSLHSAGHAVDVNYSTLAEADQRIILEAAEAAGLNWGGKFRTPDWPHFYQETPIDRRRAIQCTTQLTR